MTSRLGSGRQRWRIPCALTLLAAIVAIAATAPGGAVADHASQPSSSAAGQIGTGSHHSCAVVASAVRCWGYGGDGALGYGNTRSIGDDEAPSSAGPVDLGGRSVKAIAVGSVHTCALLHEGKVYCWGFGGNGRLGYGHTTSIGDDESPASVGPVFLGEGRTATSISAGDGHTCAVLDDASLRCWGFNLDGRLGYLHTQSIGDDPRRLPGATGPVPLADNTTGSAGPVQFGGGRTVKAVTAGGFHTCAILDDDSVRCWGYGGDGRLGYGDTRNIGRQPAGPVVPATNPVTFVESPETAGPVDLGSAGGVKRTAKAISAGYGHTCVVLDDDRVLCWGFGGYGRLGYGSVQSIGDSPERMPAMVEPVDLGAGRTARAIDAGEEHTCALMDNARVRCWGRGAFSALGYGSTENVGDAPTPAAGVSAGPVASVGPVDLGSGAAAAISAGKWHSCTRMDDDSVRCWGRGANGRLGLCAVTTIGDNEPPSSVGSIALGIPGVPGTACPAAAPAPAAPPAAAVTTPTIVHDAPVLPPAQADELASAIAAQRLRMTAMRDCRRDVTRRLTSDRRRALALASSRRRLARLQAAQRAARGRATCVRRHGRTPGRVTGLTARPSAGGKIQLSFRVAGTDGSKPPAARRYLVKQSERPIRTARDFKRAAPLCRGMCSFDVTRLDATATLTVTDLRRNRRYHYAVAARDNVSGRTGPRSKTVTTRAR